jgi:Rps23 Pro-64 3,4-dihydroxylase Tpa1-like proline 4-hydroxylase
MTPKQILDSLSETLMRDERILSAQERTLLGSLLQHARTATCENPETQDAVRTVIASAVGETVAQRAFAVLGGSIVERILESSALPLTDPTDGRLPDIYGRPDPQAPGVKAPRKPLEPLRGPKPPMADPQAPGSPMTTPAPDPQAPGHPLSDPQAPSVRAPRKPSHEPLRAPGPTPDPQAPGHQIDTTVVSKSSAGIAERPAVLPAQCVVLDEFLAPQEVEELMRFSLAHEGDFSTSEVVSPTEVSGIVNYEHRRSRVLMNLAQHQDVVLDRIKAVLPQVLHKLGMEEFSIASVEAQVTASNDGDFFHFHSDNNSQPVASRHLTFVYFFHREPRQFEGGELRIHDARLEGGVYVSQGSYQTIVPQQNQIVFFPCQLLHEITALKCPSQLFADSRFTLNGWLRQQTTRRG